MPNQFNLLRSSHIHEDDETEYEEPDSNKPALSDTPHKNKENAA